MAVGDFWMVISKRSDLIVMSVPLNWMGVLVMSVFWSFSASLLSAITSAGVFTCCLSACSTSGLRVSASAA